jgi:hypothetical protein
MSETLTLPAGHLAEGFVTPDLSPSLGGGTLPQEEVDQAAARDAEQQAEETIVVEHEHTTATAIRDDRLDTSGIRVSGLVPSWVSITNPEPVLLHVLGSGFTESTQIWWHDHLETTVFVSEAELTTWVCPWLFLNPDVIDVGVKETAEGSEGDGDQLLPFGLMP